MFRPKILITGGAGFIGSNLVKHFLNSNYQVIALDNLITGNLNNISEYLETSYFQFIQANASNRYKIGDENLQAVLHFASPASPRDFEKLSLDILKVNSLGTLNALEIAKEAGASFMLASTSEIYGDPEIHPQPESYLGNVNPLSIRGIYDESKRFSETLTMSYHRTYGLDTKIIRIFNTYGPNMKNDGRLIPSFIYNALHNKDLEVYGDGTQTRSLCYIDDLVRGIDASFNIRHHLPINLGSDVELSVNEIADKVLDIVNKRFKTNSKIVYVPLKHKDDPKMRCPDLTKARSILNWDTKTDLDNGINLTLEYFASVYEKELK